VEVAPADKTLPKRVREAQMLGVNYTLVVGAQEEADGTVTARPRNDDGAERAKGEGGGSEGTGAAGGPVFGIAEGEPLLPVSGTVPVEELVSQLQQRIARYQ
jgi:threonyl-tRNA synthetase